MKEPIQNLKYNIPIVFAYKVLEKIQQADQQLKWMETTTHSAAINTHTKYVWNDDKMCEEKDASIYFNLNKFRLYNLLWVLNVFVVAFILIIE